MYPLFEGQCANNILHSATSVKAGHRDPCGSKNTRVIDVLETMEVPENSHTEIRAGPPQKGSRIESPNKSAPTNAHGRSKWKPLCSRKTVTQLASQSHGGTTHTTGVLKWMARNPSEGIGEEEEAVGQPCMLRTVLSLITAMEELSVSEQESEGRATGQISWWESITDTQP